MEEVSTIGLDIAKQVFHGEDGAGATVFSRRITRQKLIEWQLVGATISGARESRCH